MKPIVIVVPDGLAYDLERRKAMPKPSFVFRAVLDEVVKNFRDQKIILAPANFFGGDVSEQEAACKYLLKNQVESISFPTSVERYIDTRANAALLRIWLEENGMWPTPPAILVVATHHARRAVICFRKENFPIVSCCPVQYQIPKFEQIVPRLKYYRLRRLHIIYEFFATIYDFFRPANNIN
ncbi:YdcF family protein [Polynucleobacter sp. Tro8-14-1]|uniref:YdcF family protein n=1 Tax=Polynucleobacter sp. Tro8-14-1 TaxID=1758383 RepID=UPI001C0E4450|nr:ElyC/SanA/YdcF family protein [Polynucleobacter sp. Tro8-14-1]MBU3563632.1 YdcF family protein [Polynucleobacter sp. Tro8-14-1]